GLSSAQLTLLAGWRRPILDVVKIPKWRAPRAGENVSSRIVPGDDATHGSASGEQITKEKATERRSHETSATFLAAAWRAPNTTLLLAVCAEGGQGCPAQGFPPAC